MRGLRVEVVTKGVRSWRNSRSLLKFLCTVDLIGRGFNESTTQALENPMLVAGAVF